MEENANKALTFGFEEGQDVATISKEQIDGTLEMLNSRREPLANRPVQIGEFIDVVNELFDKNNLIANLEEMEVNKKFCRIVAPKEVGRLSKEMIIEAGYWLIEKMILKFVMPNHSEKGYAACMAVSFNDKGIQVAWGTNVASCNNLCVWGENTMSTYQNKYNQKTAWDHILLRLEKWMSEVEQKFDFDRKVIQYIMNTRFDNTEGEMVRKIIGDLMMRAVESTYIDTRAERIFSINDMSRFTQHVLENPEKLSKNPTVWDLYNYGTNILNPAKTDPTVMIDVNRNWGKYVMENFVPDINDKLEQTVLV